MANSNFTLMGSVDTGEPGVKRYYVVEDGVKRELTDEEEIKQAYEKMYGKHDYSVFREDVTSVNMSDSNDEEELLTREYIPKKKR